MIASVSVQRLLYVRFILDLLKRRSKLLDASSPFWIRDSPLRVNTTLYAPRSITVSLHQDSN
jgi:hypothetical protein